VKNESVVKAAAWLEIVVGATLVAAPDLVSQLLFGGAAAGTAGPLGRFAGVALFALGLGSVRSAGESLFRSAATALFIFNAGTAALLAWVATATMLRGVLLWPAVALHAAIALALSWTLRTAPRHP
jgi:hypothetical protein